MPTPRKVPQREFRFLVKVEGLIWLGIGSILFLFIGILLSKGYSFPAALKEYRLIHGSMKEVDGVITSVEQTRVMVNDSRIWKFDFRFSIEGARTVSGVAYASAEIYVPGTTVPVRYLVNDETVALPAETRFSEIPLRSSFVLLFPAIGLALGVVTGWRWLTIRRLFRHGRYEHAVVTKVDRKLMGSKEKPSYVVSIRLDDGSKRSKRTHWTQEIEYALKALESGATADVLVQPDGGNYFLFMEPFRGLSVT